MLVGVNGWEDLISPQWKRHLKYNLIVLSGSSDGKAISVLEGIRVVISVKVEGNVARVLDGRCIIVGEGLEERKRGIVSDGTESLSGFVANHIVKGLVFQNLGKGGNGNVVSELPKYVGEFVIKERGASAKGVANGEGGFFGINIAQPKQRLVTLENGQFLVQQVGTQFSD